VARIKLWPVWEMRFRDLDGRVQYIPVYCRVCRRSGRYRVDRLIVRRGLDGSVRQWLNDISADCPDCAGRQQWFYPEDTLQTPQLVIEAIAHPKSSK
jgi:hypothetical protein